MWTRQFKRTGERQPQALGEGLEGRPQAAGLGSQARTLTPGPPTQGRHAASCRCSPPTTGPASATHCSTCPRCLWSPHRPCPAPPHATSYPTAPPASTPRVLMAAGSTASGAAASSRYHTGQASSWHLPSSLASSFLPISLAHASMLSFYSRHLCCPSCPGTQPLSWTPSPELPNLLTGSLLWLFIPFPPPLGPFQPPPLSVASYSAFEILGGSNRHLPSPQPRVGFSSETVAVGVV